MTEPSFLISRTRGPAQERHRGALRNVAVAILFAAAFAPQPATAAAAAGLPDVYRVDSTHSYLGFRVKHLGFSWVRGRFRSWSGAIAFDPGDISRSSVTIMAEASSIDTGSDGRDRDLQRPYFFAAEEHPLIFFQSQRVEGGPDRFVAHGILSIKGVARPVSIPFTSMGSITVENDSRRIGFAGEFTLLRADFGVVHEGNILETSGTIGKEVEIEFEVAASHVDYADSEWARFTSRSSAGEAVLALIESEGIEAGIERLDAWEKAKPEGITTSTTEYAIAAARLAREEKAADAIRLLKALTAARPDDRRARILLAETELAAGDRQAAEDTYRAALAVDPMSGEAVERLRQLDGKTGEVTIGTASAAASRGKAAPASN